tara:strand:- start:3008 stop:3193 length:186 start_codon:yes stop_codon:yes gene_type:complete
MIDFLNNIRYKLSINKKKRRDISVLSLEKKVMKLNIKSEKYLELAKRQTKDWEEKWSKKVK